MKITDIIKNDNDRLFVVDLECFIIFTGDELSDIRPFIRIGTWSDLPIRLIPLIENIIITDSITGWPSQEQFNIDVRNFNDNRYIGKESALNRFLKYQRNFGLDLTNVTSVNVEKDIPELQEEKNISKSDHFVGIFYSDGNIHIRHKGLKFFDLQKITEKNFNFEKINDILLKQAKENRRYEGGGFILLDKNPMFYNKEYFTSYQCQNKYFRSFSKLSIDPSKIRELLLPSENLINISALLKLKNSKNAKLKIFSNNRDQVNLIKELYSKAVITDETFSNIHYSTGDGLKFESYLGTPNLKVSFKGKPNEDLINLAFIKSPQDVQKIISDKPDIVLITYTAYEKSVLLFKSADIPILIIDDGNPNIKKINDQKCICLIGEMQYDIKRCNSIEETVFLKIYSEELSESFKTKDFARIDEIIENLSKSDQQADFFNSISAIKALQMTTSDRDFYNKLQEIYLKYNRKINKEELSKNNDILKVELFICNTVVIEFLSSIQASAEQNILSDTYDKNDIDRTSPRDESLLSQRITEDRERLNKLIGLLYDNIDKTMQSELLENVAKLEHEIDRRREVYGQEIFLGSESDSISSTENNIDDIHRRLSHQPSSANSYSIGSNKKEKNGEQKSAANWLSNLLTGNKNSRGSDLLSEDKEDSGSNSSEINSDSPDSSAISNDDFKDTSPLKKFKTKKTLLLLLFIIFLIASGISYKITTSDSSGNNKIIISEDDINNLKPDITKTISVIRTTPEEKEQIKNYNIKISAIDIYKYANDVAIKNGYAELANKGLKEKNPHWIYPSNIFIMLDGESVTVRKGDTLWDLSKTKLEKMSILFHDIIEKVDVAKNDSDFNLKLLKKASVYAYLERHKNRIKQLHNKIKDED